MRHDVCNKQRLYDEFLDELREACLATLAQDTEWLDMTAGLPRFSSRPQTAYERERRIAPPIYVSEPRFTISVDVEL